MKRKRNICFYISLILAVFLIFYNVNTVFKAEKTQIKPTQKSVNTFFFDDSLNPFFEETTAPAEPIQNSTSSETVEVMTGDIKGKIIEKYISPYSAATSYDSVYMKNSTGLTIDIKSLLEAKLPFSLSKTDKPQVLILHTHATETYMPYTCDYYTSEYNSRTTDNSKNMVRIGEIISNMLNNAGISVIHAKTQHDYPSYTGSYSNSAKTVCDYIKKYPSIKVVLDLHRDALSSGNDKYKLVSEINGKKAAQVMLVMGSQSGTVTNYPNWKENLKLAVRLQQIIEKNYPTLARPMVVASKNYNQSLTNGSMLIEFGTDANALSEAEYSAQLVGECLIKLFRGMGA